MTQTKFKVAQISDVHLPLTAWPAFGDWNLKRFLGFLNWQRKRRFVHRRAILDLLMADMQSERPDHIVVSGDLVNLGTRREYDAARKWLETLGSPDQVSVIPGNHDIYCPSPPGQSCLDVWLPYVNHSTDDVGYADALSSVAHTSRTIFPYVRRIGPIALIGMNSAVPTPPGIARGSVGTSQRQRLKALLQDVASAGLFACLMIHHPPLPGLAVPRRALADADRLADIIQNCPVGLVIHGHNHRDVITWIDTARPGIGKVAVCGAASGSAARHHKHEQAARYYLFEFHASEEGMIVDRVTRGLHDDLQHVREIERQRVTPFCS